MNNFKRCTSVCTPIYCDCKEGECKVRNDIQNLIKMKPTVETWLSNVSYDPLGQYLWNTEENGEKQMVADIRGFGALQYMFDTPKDVYNFQEKVGEFIAQAIREKIERLKNQ